MGSTSRSLAKAIPFAGPFFKRSVSRKCARAAVLRNQRAIRGQFREKGPNKCVSTSSGCDATSFAQLCSLSRALRKEAVMKKEDDKDGRWSVYDCLEEEGEEEVAFSWPQGQEWEGFGEEWCQLHETVCSNK